MKCFGYVRGGILFSAVLVSAFFAAPRFAQAKESPKATVPQAQQIFHRILDTYSKANTDLRLRVEARAGDLDDRTETFLLSLIRGEESVLLSLRSDLYSAMSSKDVSQLARKAKMQRDAMKAKERQVIVPLLDVSEILGTLLPTAEQRLQELDSVLTKQRYDRFSSMLADVRKDAETLRGELLGAKPPSNGGARVKQLQSKLKLFYSSVRVLVK